MAQNGTQEKDNSVSQTVVIEGESDDTSTSAKVDGAKPSTGKAINAKDAVIIDMGETTESEDDDLLFDSLPGVKPVYKYDPNKFKRGTNNNNNNYHKRYDNGNDNTNISEEKEGIKQGTGIDITGKKRVSFEKKGKLPISDDEDDEISQDEPDRKRRRTLRKEPAPDTFKYRVGMDVLAQDLDTVNEVVSKKKKKRIN